MRVTFFSSKPYDQTFFGQINSDFGFELTFLEARLNKVTAALAEGAETVCAFVNDTLDRETLEKLAAGGTRLIAMRCAGYNNVDIRIANKLGIQVCHVPRYLEDCAADLHLAVARPCISSMPRRRRLLRLPPTRRRKAKRSRMTSIPIRTC